MAFYCLDGLRGINRPDVLRLVNQISNIGAQQLPNLIDNIPRTELGHKINAKINKSASSSNASAVVDRWIESGIQFLTSSDFKKLNRPELEKFGFLFARGPTHLLQQPTASILNSRKSKVVSPDDDWLKTTLMATKEAVSRGYTIISGLGQIQYSVVTTACQDIGLVLVCEGPMPFMLQSQTLDNFYREYSGIINFSKTLFISAHGNTLLGLKPSAQILRDQIIAAMSDYIYAIRIRHGGNMSRVLSEAAKQGAQVRHFTKNSREDNPTKKDTLQRNSDGIDGPSAKIISPKFKTPDSLRIKPEFSEHLKSWLVSASGAKSRFEEPDFSLFHYTRRTLGAWPGQTQSDYLKSLVKHEPLAAHSAFDTISRIVIEKRIRSSSRLIRGMHRVVSFTEIPPYELTQIRKWRTGLYRWSVEPYGITISKSRLIQKGARPVRYGPPESYLQIVDEEKFLFQLEAAGKHDWSVEREWRILGDVYFADVPTTELAFIFPSESEAARFAELMGKAV